MVIRRLNDDVSVIRHTGAAIAIKMGGIVKPEIGMTDLNSPSNTDYIYSFLDKLKDFASY